MAFRTPIRVCFSDIDYAGIVYYPRFLHYFHVALEEFFGVELRIDYPALLINQRIGFPTVHLETDFSKPLNYGDKVQVEVIVKRIGRTSITWAYKVYQMDDPETLTVQGHNVTVTVNLDTFEKMETPQWLRDQLASYQKRCSECQEGP